MNKNIDDDFIEMLQDKIKELEGIDNKVLKQLNSFEGIISISFFINKSKPKSKYRTYKKHILLYLDGIMKSNKTDKELINLYQLYLSGILGVIQDKHGFYNKENDNFLLFLDLLIDVILIIIGIAKFYYYLPIVTILLLIRRYWRIKKAKKEGKYINIPIS